MSATHNRTSVICTTCEERHLPYGEGGELQELGEREPVDGGWRCDCGALLTDRDVMECLSAMAEDAAEARAEARRDY